MVLLVQSVKCISIVSEGTSGKSRTTRKTCTCRETMAYKSCTSGELRMISETWVSYKWYESYES